ncbi:hypothetical protein [Maricaulis sp.]|jgi:hypothetical protein|uniref:hypothetical protein n=1 Tax=Maricaulis sp. TaxID=1486257 RepID=UPI00261D1BF6|nr:hypothetical protein [Maricaulis sp.]MDF1767643.1 hypothetical protein [Maricaulis sp.]
MSRLFLLQLVHTMVFIVCIACLLPIGWYAASGDGAVWAIWALLPPVGVFLGLLLNRGRCILQTLARRMRGIEETDSRWVRDILFLPESWALRVVPVMVPVFLLVIVASASRAIASL